MSGQSPAARLPFVGEDGGMPVISARQSGQPSRLVYARSLADSNIWRVETPASGVPSASPPFVSISSTRWDLNPQISPDGNRVAFESTRSGGWEVWLADPDGSNAEQLTSMGVGISGTPRWSHDGQLIAFDSNSAGQFEIYVIPAAGGRPRRLTSHPANEHHPSFSRDGKWIYFTSNRTGEYQIWKIPTSGGDAVQVTSAGSQVAFESTDAAHLYYIDTVGTAPSGLWRVSTSGGQAVKLLDGVVARAFAVAEQGIYYIDRPSTEARLHFFNFAKGQSVTIARNLGDVRSGLAVSPDGRAILYSRTDSSIDDLMLVENFQ